MQRRQFLKSALTASAATVAATGTSLAQPAAGGREYYQLRKYHLFRGPGIQRIEAYFRDALIPTLNRMGMKNIGAFSVNYGPETPTYYLVIPSTDLTTLANLDNVLSKDEAFVKLAEPYWKAPVGQPNFITSEYSLLSAFDGWPKITPPDTTKKRIFHLRTYISPTHFDHIRKVEMFHHGEFRIFNEAGCGQVFYGDRILGQPMPSLTYMLTFPDMAALEAGWAKFVAHPDWKKLSTDPYYAFEPTVTSVDSIVLNPLAMSQV